MQRFRWLACVAIVVVLVVGYALPWWQARDNIQYEVVAQYPHDPLLFTEGLIWHEGALLETSGHYGLSHIRLTDRTQNSVLQDIPLPSEIFAEGIVVLGDYAYVLTWREHKVLVFDTDSWQQIRSFPLEGEGWGMTTDGTSLIASNGTDTLTWYEPQTGSVIRKLQVRHPSKKVGQLNELEWIHGKVWANIWPSRVIGIIDPVDGVMQGRVDLNNIAPQDGKRDVLNGIAYHPDTGLVTVTGKLWPEMFDIRLVCGHDEPECSILLPMIETRYNHATPSE